SLIASMVAPSPANGPARTRTISPSATVERCSFINRSLSLFMELQQTSPNAAGAHLCQTMPGALEHRNGPTNTGSGHSSLLRWSAEDSIWRMSLSGSFQVQEAHIELLRNRWHALTAKHSDDESAREAGFRSIVQHYSEPKRAYHNLSHIKALIALHDELK